MTVSRLAKNVWAHPVCVQSVWTYGVPSVSKILTKFNAIIILFVYLSPIHKRDTDLAKYLPDLYIIYMGLI